MGVQLSLQIGITGLQAANAIINSEGNNLSNTNTVAFKSFRAELATSLFYNTSIGSAATATFPGSNPLQTGLGALVGGIPANFAQGPVVSSGLQNDLAIQGVGFFQLAQSGNNYYTRNGQFSLNNAQQLISSNGMNVQGYGVDANFNVDTSTVTNVTIPLGTQTLSVPTTLTVLQGNLNPTGTVASQATIRQTPATSATALTNALSGITVGGQPIIDDGSGTGFNSPVTINYTPRKDGGALEPLSLTFNPGDPLSKLTDFIVNAQEINTSITQPTGNTAGATLQAGGQLQVIGNLGTANNFTIDSTDFAVVNASSGAIGTFRLDFDNLVQTSNGEGTAISFNVFDSDGSPVTLDTTAYLSSLGTESSQFTMLYSSPENSVTGSQSRTVGTAVLTFDSAGRLTSVVPSTVSIARDNTGATNPLTFTTDYSGVAALSQTSRLSLASQNGAPTGTLVNYGFDEEGNIIGQFSNGLNRTVGQVILARFDNPNGLLALENTLYVQGPNSGDPTVFTAGGVEATIAPQSVEQSNTNITNSLVNLTRGATAFAANSRAIATSQDLFNAVLQIARQ